MIKRFSSTLLIASISLLCSQSTLASHQSLSKSTPQKKMSRIIGGDESRENAFPFMTGLISAGESEINPFCGASFVGGRYVLTAAHCIDGSEADDVEVWIGGFDVTKPEGGKRVKVAQIYAHESYDNYTTNNDIAVLELVEEVENVTPVKIISPEMEATLADGFEFTVMGWGNVNVQEPQYPQRLHQVNVPLYNREQCLKDYAVEGQSEPAITEQMMCAGFVEGGKDSCQGDSGGPLVFQQEQQWYQAGVVSFGNGCADANSPGVYTRLSQFNQWLSEKQAGVSYRQYTRQGFVEKDYDEAMSFSVKNVSQTPFTVTQAKVTGLDNLEKADITENQCEGKRLSFDESCDIKIQVKTNQLGDGKFSLSINTDNPANQQADMFYSSNTLEQESLDLAALTGSSADLLKWWGGGDANWQSQSAKASQGDSAAASGDISHGQNSVLLATIDNDRVKSLSFKYLVSSELDYDKFVVLHNNKQVVADSGTQNTEFSNQTIELKMGKDRITFLYYKDSTDEDAIGDDKAYLDELTTKLQNTAPKALVKTSSISVEEGKPFTLDASGSSDPDSDNISYTWQVTSSSKVNLSKPQEAVQTLTAPAYSEATNLTFEVRVTDALGASSTATVSVKITEKPKSSGGTFVYLLLPLLLIVFRRTVK